LGQKFLIENKAVIDVANNSLIINNDNKNKLSNELNKNNVVFTLKPRTETIGSGRANRRHGHGK